ncbi:hypothetical protein [Avrilella dinanensis]|uniref:hypothetical protein n=1 Tax=Avrilella dinanensis TaxID=2008672 RepID=UPI00240A1FC3|nr:hypothetical protein [Avrilella dinanensis]
MEKKERILATASESAILLKNISGDVYIESRAYTRWIFFEKTKVMLDKSTMYLLPNKTVLGNNLLGIVQIDVGKNNQFINKNSEIHLILFEIKSERKYIKLICKETETTTKKYKIVLNFSNLPDKEIILKYLSDLGFEIENEPS